MVVGELSQALTPPSASKIFFVSKTLAHFFIQQIELDISRQIY
jgi:hypothetical protein